MADPEVGMDLADVNVDELLAGLMSPEKAPAEAPAEAPAAPVANGAQTGEDALAAALDEVVAASEQSVTEPDPEPQPVPAKKQTRAKTPPAYAPTPAMTTEPSGVVFPSGLPLDSFARLILGVERLCVALERSNAIAEKYMPAGEPMMLTLDELKERLGDAPEPEPASDRPYTVWPDGKDEPPGGQDLDGPSEDDDKPRKRGRGRPRKNTY